MSSNSFDLYVFASNSPALPTSNFCLKTLYASRYLGFEPRVVPTGKVPKWATNGCLPAAKIAGETFNDSTDILQKLESLPHNGKRLYPTDPRQLSDTIFLEDWCDEVFVNYYLYYASVPDQTAQLFRDNFTASIMPGVASKILGRLVRGMIRKAVVSQGIGNLPESQVTQQLNRYFDALNARLGTSNFLVGTEPTAADFAFFGHIKNCYFYGYPQYTKGVDSRANLAAWYKRMEDLCGAQSTGGTQKAAAA